MVIGVVSLDCFPSFFVLLLLLFFFGRSFERELREEGTQERDRREIVFVLLRTKLSFEDRIGRFQNVLDLVGIITNLRNQKFFCFKIKKSFVFLITKRPLNLWYTLTMFYFLCKEYGIIYLHTCRNKYIYIYIYIYIGLGLSYTRCNFN